MKSIVVQLLVALLMLGATELAFARVLIRSCQKQPVATRNIQKAIHFISANIDRVLYHPELKALTEADRQRYKWVLFQEDFPIICRPGESHYCLHNGKPINGYTHEIDRYTPQRGHEARGIYLCNSERSNYLGCKFYATIAHEIAHLADLPKLPNHDILGRGVNRTGDLIYILDDIVERLCSQSR